MRSAQYMDVIEKKAIPDMQKAFPDGSGVFQQDLAPSHTSKIVTNFFKISKIKVLGWPGNSPDLNPIYRKCMVYHKDSSPQQGLYNQNQANRGHNSVWYHDEQIQENCENLIDSMPKRVLQVIENKGGHTSY